MFLTTTNNLIRESLGVLTKKWTKNDPKSDISGGPDPAGQTGGTVFGPFSLVLTVKVIKKYQFYGQNQ